MSILKEKILVCEKDYFNYYQYFIYLVLVWNRTFFFFEVQVETKVIIFKK